MEFVDEYGNMYIIPDKIRVTLGRGDDNDITIPSTESGLREQYRKGEQIPEKYFTVSRHHAVFFPYSRKIIDINSRFGILINGILISPEKMFQIKNGDRVNLGRLELTFMEESKQPSDQIST